jgi:hypothetical protein
MQKLLLSLFALVLSVVLMAQKTVNDPHAEKRTVGNFHGIEVGTGIELTLSQGNSEEVAVSASKPEYRERIVTKIENGILKIQYDSKIGSINKKKESKNLKAYVSFKSLDILHANTGAEVKTAGSIKSNNLEIKTNTGALIDGRVEVITLKVNLNTGSKINLYGVADNLTVDGDTGSKFKGEDLNTKNCNVTVSTGASIIVKAENELQVKANTGGVVRYKGNASIKEIKTNTGGSVTKI